MAGIRRLSGAVVLAAVVAVIVAVVVAVGLIGLTAAAPGGAAPDGSGGTAAPDGSVVRPFEAQRAMAPVKRELGESVAIMLAAVLAGVAGIGAASGTRSRPRRAGSTTTRPLLLAVRLRGPPSFQLV